MNDVAVSNAYNQLQRELEPLRAELLAHRIYRDVDSVARLRVFMQVHVFAVWDFMCLAKRLQRDLTCTDVVWRPPARPSLARFANEIILAEESDHDLDGAPSSHLEMYLAAMDEVGASTAQFRRFLAALAERGNVADALLVAEVPSWLQSFVGRTVDCARSDDLVAVMAAFLFGREDLIPAMFERLGQFWRVPSTAAPHFVYYLERHIELDGDHHGPMAAAALDDLAGQSPAALRDAARAARRALSSRLELWDGALALVAAA